MFRMLVLQALNNLSDEQVEYQVRDRLSFSRFLGLAIEDSIPDATTLWLFREKLAKAGLIEQLFDRFDQHLAAKGYMARGGQIIDASIVLVPTQRNSRDENAELQAGRTPAGWKQKPAKVRQKDRDARWTKKHGRSFFGYKNHVNADAKHKLIRHYAVTDAAVHDSQELDGLLDTGNTCNDVFADSAYRSAKMKSKLRASGYNSRIHRRGRRNHPLSLAQIRVNHAKSRISARIEHVFGAQLDRWIDEAIPALKARHLRWVLGRHDYFEGPWPSGAWASNPSSAPNVPSGSFRPILFRLPLHRRRLRVLELEPVGQTANPRQLIKQRR